MWLIDGVLPVVPGTLGPDRAQATDARSKVRQSVPLAWQLFQQGRVRHVVLSNPYDHARNLVTRLLTPKFGRSSP